MTTATSNTQPQAPSGLRGVVVGDTKISYVDGERGELVYRGIDIHDLANNATFEEVAYLLWFGALPSAANLAAFSADLGKRRALPDRLIKILREIPDTATPMDVLRTTVSAMALFDRNAKDISAEANLEKAKLLTAVFPTILASFYRLSEGDEPLPPKPELSTAANFLYMFTGKEADPQAARLLDAALVLHADHGMNASTFASMVTAATLADMYGAITSAVATLKGPLHGGANEGVIANLMEIGTPDAIEGWVAAKLAKHEKIMGFGHAVYKTNDPRALDLKRIAKEAGERAGSTKWVDMTERMEKAVWDQRKLYANVDLYSASVYYTLGIPPTYFTPVFAMSRITGWCAHLIEQYANNKLIRPGEHYVGPRDVRYIPIAERTADIPV
ncbi:MAG: citrate synthase [Candidatus Eremiobacteraeota bacterium]|nr:citrate synthase [Candidatus Eremiobacteraeota bacterium]MBV8338604.1 citrate synthase [Candidatus Eremiobacteraeota bacterium]